MSILLLCARCGKKFSPHRASKNPKYCSAACYRSRPKAVTPPCSKCGKPGTHARAGHAAHEFCRTCFHQHQKDTLVDRFWSKVNKNGPVPTHRPDLGPCWLWTAGTHNGYGAFRDKERALGAHVFSLQQHLGRKVHKWVLHQCDVPLCVNPDHLSEGTPAENSADMVAKGRSARGDRSPSRIFIAHRPRGERHHSAKLTEDAVKEIRAQATLKGVMVLARAFGVSKSVIQNVLWRKTWKHVL